MAQLGSKQKRRSQITNRVIGTSPLQQRPKHKRSVPRSAAGSGPSRDGPRLAQGLCPLSQHVSLCPTCLAPLHPFPAMRPDWHKAQRGALFKALLTTRQSLRGIKNTTLATTPLPMTNHPSFLRKHPEDRCNKLVKCVGLPRVLRVRGCLSEGKSRADGVDGYVDCTPARSIPQLRGVSPGLLQPFYTNQYRRAAGNRKKSSPAKIFEAKA